MSLIIENVCIAASTNNINVVADTNNASTVVSTNNTNKINTKTTNTDSITETPISANNDKNKHMHSKQIQNKCMQGLTILKEKGECISYKNLRVIYVLKSNIDLYNSALVREEDDNNMGLTMLIVDNEDKVYYDEQVIKLPKNKCFRMIGTYRYHSGGGYYKTVPVVVID